ncbi:MAG: hypothetical protein L3J35_03065 [Bacteroidales bacterium]|nr:hypothetical protein [Bacteroidales bacterium]
MYKKTIITISVFIFAMITVFSQNHIEALRYSQQFYSSTAKSEAMGNALSAVGADFSSLMINPAGIAVFNSRQVAFTPNFIVSNTKATLSDNTINDGKIGFNFSNIAYVNTIKTNGIIKSFSLGMAYNSFNDFRNKTYVSADNQNGSILDFMIYNENNDRASIFREDLAWNTWLYNQDLTTGEYWSFLTDDGTYGLTQTKEIRTSGGVGEFSFTLGTNINDVLYLGGTIGFTSVNYKYKSTYTETNFPAINAEIIESPGDSTLVNPNRIEFNETLYTEGSGINAKFGMIFQPVKFLRIGGAVHTSTLYDFTDEYFTSMDVRYPVADADGNSEYNSESDDNIFEWRLKTPFRANAGVAFILDSYKIGKFFTVPMILSLDYEYVDYSSAELRNSYFDDSGNDFGTANNRIGNIYKETHNIRAGAEFNFGFMKVRGGYALYSSPYSADEGFSNAKSVYSGGLGFASEHSYIDFSYSFLPTTEKLNLYNATDIFPDNPIGNITEPQAIAENKKQFFKVTFGFRF